MYESCVEPTSKMSYDEICARRPQWVYYDGAESEEDDDGEDYDDVEGTVRR